MNHFKSRCYLPSSLKDKTTNRQYQWTSKRKIVSMLSDFENLIAGAIYEASFL